MIRTLDRKVIWALLLSMPIPSIGVWLGMFQWPGSNTGDLAFAIAKVWVIAFPLLWLFLVNGKLQWPPINGRGITIGIVSGLLMAGVILVSYAVIGSAYIDPEELRQQMSHLGLLDSRKFLLLALYWTFINALIEEYFWRWFIVSQAQLSFSKTAAIVLSALGFVAHHLLAMSIYFDFSISLLACVGIFFAGLVWSYLYAQYKNLLPGYISHIFADAAIFGIAYYLLFLA